ncbi:MAG TPA: hypothetical protein PLP61_01160 [Nocardioides sp.]|uniref:hypothetical protein n=1 Tax=Nocardioides sp. TaxID=35761 RepID=UPI002CD560C4|nr:hypothetical protein [Nocardioides sp.]HQR25619.1 hypothetical protein [Nocardioides sp.]
MPAAVRAGLALALLLLGVVTGLATVAVHGSGWGLALGLAATLATTLALPRGWWTRLPFVVGWVGFVGFATVPRPEGDYLIAADVPGYTLLATGLVLVVLALVTLPAPRRGSALGSRT